MGHVDGFGEVAKQEERAAMAPRLSEGSSENEEEESLGSIMGNLPILGFNVFFIEFLNIL